MQFEIRQIDAWKDPEGTWTYNNSMPVGEFKIEGEPTARKLLKAVRRMYDLPAGKYKIDDYYAIDGVWVFKQRSNNCPVFDLIEK